MASLAFYERSEAGQRASAREAFLISRLAGGLTDRRARYVALQHANAARADTTAVRAEMLACEQLRAQIERDWALDSGARGEGGESLRPANSATRQYQAMLESRAAETVSEGTFKLGPREFVESVELREYKLAEAKRVALAGPFRIQDEQPVRIEQARALAQNNRAYVSRIENTGRTRAPRPGAAQLDEAHTAAQTFMHAERVRRGRGPEPVRGRMHAGSGIRTRFSAVV